MAFQPSALRNIDSSLSTAQGVWVYGPQADAHGTVEGTGYFANGKRLGMKVGDIVIVARDSSAVTMHLVTASTAAVSAASPLPSSAFNQAFNCTVAAASS